jgi:dTDP-4-amino-4,6-dideoxygalactose transaminase
MKNAEFLAGHCSSLPLFPEMTEEEIERVIEACNSFKG